MWHNKIKVRFFSTNTIFADAVSAFFADEVDFSYQGLPHLDDLRYLNEDALDLITIIDLTEVLSDFNLILDKSEINFLSFPFVFIIDNHHIRSHIQTRFFNYFEILNKPINLNKLLSKVRILSGRKRVSSENQIFIRGNYFEVRKKLLKNSHGGITRLTEKETLILYFLFKQRGEVIPKDDLLKIVWGYDKTISTHTLETHIYRLRKKINDGLGEAKFILKTKQGYYLNLS